MNKVQRMLISLFILLSSVAGGAHTAAARASAAPLAVPLQQGATPAATCDELQVIAIADQSGSMAGYTDSAGRYFPPTDPGGFRFAGPKYIADTLLGIHPFGYQDVQFKLAVIDFGDTPQVRLGWTDLNPQTDVEAATMTNDLAPVFDPTEALGNTVPGEAVEQAASLFAQQEAVRAQVDGCPRRLIILFTDGLPYDDVAGFNYQTHLSNLATYARNFLPYPDNRLYVIGLDQNGAFYDQTLDAWADVTGSADQVRLARSDAEMGSLIAQILNENLAQTGGTAAVRGCAENGRVVVPPYMQLVRFSLFKVDQTLSLDINDPDGQPVQSGRPGVTITGQTGAVETITVNNPQPGVWSVLTQLPVGTEDQCLISFLAIVAEEEVVEPQAGSSYSQFTRVPIAFQLVDSLGNSLPDYGEDQYDLQMDVGLNYDGGQEQPVSFSANPGQQYRGEIIPYFSGQASVLVNATAQDDNAQIYNIFPGNTDDPDKMLEIAAFQVTPVRFIGRDLPAGGLRVAQHSELPLEFALVDDADQPITIELPVTVELALVNAAGEATPLPAPTSSGGVYNTVSLLSEDGPQTLTYAAHVTVPPQGNQPERTVTLGEGEVSFNVFPVHRIRAEFGEVGGVATDPFLRPTGLPATVRLTDEDGQAIGPAIAGAPNPMQIFEVTVRNQADGQVVLQGDNLLTTTGEAGVFQLVDNDLGRGDYTIEVRPATTLAEDYTWEAPEWVTPATGTINQLFYGVLGATAAAVGLISLAVFSYVRVRRHPLTGKIEIYQTNYEQSYEEEGKHDQSDRRLYSHTLSGNKNKYTLRPNAGGITKIEVTSPNEAASKSKTASVKMHRKVGMPIETSLVPGRKHQISGTNYYVIKDPSASSSVDSGMDELPSEF